MQSNSQLSARFSALYLPWWDRVWIAPNAFFVPFGDFCAMGDRAGICEERASQGKYQQAEPLYLQALEIRQQLL